MPSKKPKINKAGYYIRHWYDDVYLVSDMIKGIDYVTTKPQLFYKRKPEVTIKPVLRKEPDLDALVALVMHMVFDDPLTKWKDNPNKH